MRVGIVGLGKRFRKIYHKILHSLDAELIIWNRTMSTAVEYAEDRSDCTVASSLRALCQSELDLCLAFVPDDVNFDLLARLDFGCTLLIETPVSDQRWFVRPDVGVLEQWPSLPIEQFKQEVYRSGLIDRPYWVFNDGRSYDYHGIAQLRAYTDRAKPCLLSGFVQDRQQEGFIDKTGSLNTTSDFWTHGQVELEGGTLLSHSFSYNCKTSLLKPIQFLRSYSVNGAIISGRMSIMDDDYEHFELRYLDEDRNVVAEQIKVDRDENGRITEMSANDGQVSWKNRFSPLDFDDQQIAIATLLQDGSTGVFYPASESFIDTMTINAMKHAGVKRELVKWQ